MSIEMQLKTIEENISNILCPEIIFAMNKKYRELEEQLNNN